MIAIAPMTKDDLLDVVVIERLCFGDRWSVQAFAGELDNPSSSYFVAKEDGKIIGFCGYWLILEEAHITTIAVHPAQQRRYIGEYLLLTMVDHAAKAGAKWLTLEVRASNLGAQTLYQKYGFTSLGRRKGYYQDDGEDALVMWTENIWQGEYQERLRRLRDELNGRLTAQRDA